jgi:hypothetical protein
VYVNQHSKLKKKYEVECQQAKLMKLKLLHSNEENAGNLERWHSQGSNDEPLEKQPLTPPEDAVVQDTISPEVAVMSPEYSKEMRDDTNNLIETLKTLDTGESGSLEREMGAKTEDLVKEIAPPAPAEQKKPVEEAEVNSPDIAAKNGDAVPGSSLQSRRKTRLEVVLANCTKTPSKNYMETDLASIIDVTMFALF